MAHDLPVGVAQQKALEVLGAPAAIQTWAGAEAYFEEVGVYVRAQRVGRTSEPRVRLRHPAGGGFTAGGDGESWGAVHKLNEAQIADLKARGWWE